MTEQRVPVLIAGGSLVGLSTALFLAHNGVASLLVERHPGTSVHPRAVGYHPRTVELLRQVGLEEPVLKAAAGFATHRTRAVVESIAGREISSRDEMPESDMDALSPCRLLLLTQDRLEPILRARAEQLGADLRFGSRLDGFRQDEDGVVARLTDATGVTTTVRADYLVGADGPRSGVREALGIPRTGRGVISQHVSIAFRANLSGALRGRRFSVVHVGNDTVRGIFVHDDTLREGTLIVGYDPAKGELLDSFTDSRCEELVRAAIGEADLPIEIRSRWPWEMAEQTAARYRERRVFIAGDAAHVIPPTGGYGANTGIADAHNLAWKLAAVLKGAAGPGLLDSYDAERRPVGDFAAAQGALQLAVRAGTADERQRAQVLDATAVTMGYRYRSGAVLGADDAHPLVEEPSRWHAEPGTRAPHVPLSPLGAGSILDLFGDGFVLLVGPRGRAWCEAAEAAAASLGVELTTRLLGRDDAAGRPATGPVHPAAAVQQAYRLADAGAVLVRPDGFVAWRDDPPADLPPGGGSTVDTRSVNDLRIVLDGVLRALLARS